MNYSNEVSLFHGSDTWEAVKAGLLVAIKTGCQHLTDEQITDIGYVLQAMQDIEEAR